MKLSTPFTEDDVASLRAGDQVEISGVIYTARDAAHARFMELISKDRELPFVIEGAVLYYVGPGPARPDQVIGSAGPTTSGRMDPYTTPLLARGLKGMIGKGPRNEKVKKAIKKHRAVYLAAIGGAGALLSRHITASEVVAYEDLGPEAVRRLTVEDFPAVVINDIYGGDFYTR